MSDFFKNLSEDAKQSLKILAVVIIAVIVALSCYVCSDESGGGTNKKNIKTYVYEETNSQGARFYGEFTIDFDEEEYKYTGNDIDKMDDCAHNIALLQVAYGTIEKSGFVSDEQETRNNQKKYYLQNMGYYAWVSTDYQSLYYAGYTFTLK